MSYCTQCGHETIKLLSGLCMSCYEPSEDKMSEAKCTLCDGSGWIEYYEIDGGTIYNWQKPKKRKCNSLKHIDGGWS